VQLGNLTIQVLSTPGHTPGSVTLLCGDAMFSGDTLFAGSCGRTDFPGGSYKQMMESLRRLANLKGNYKVYPGHEGFSDLDRERRYNSFMAAALNR
jgi:glyoxylase-like metal-dependent hydrolase (beta-lactamase superfamily II)